MNCRPNELAMVVWSHPDCPIGGHVCTTLRIAPTERFQLPDGYWSIRAPSLLPAWVVEFPNPIQAPCGSGGRITHYRSTRYAVIQDAALRPLRDGPGEDETLTWCDKPQQVPA